MQLEEQLHEKVEISCRALRAYLARMASTRSWARAYGTADPGHHPQRATDAAVHRLANGGAVTVDMPTRVKLLLEENGALPA
jgi:hypothetical protein